MVKWPLEWTPLKLCRRSWKVAMFWLPVMSGRVLSAVVPAAWVRLVSRLRQRGL